jgi:RimJ/RimL family protein N-acetyltransferase
MRVIRTPRLLLRRPEPRDLDGFVAFYASERSAMNGGPLTAGRAWRAFGTQLGAWQMNGFGMFAVTFRGDDRIRGLVGPWFPGDWPEREIGWSLFDAADEGRGIAHEAARAALAHAFGPLGWTTAVSYIHPANARSRALAQRLGAVLDAAAATPPAEVTPLVFRHRRPERPA